PHQLVDEVDRHRRLARPAHGEVAHRHHRDRGAAAAEEAGGVEGAPGARRRGEEARRRDERREGEALPERLLAPVEEIGEGAHGRTSRARAATRAARGTSQARAASIAAAPPSALPARSAAAAASIAGAAGSCSRHARWPRGQPRLPWLLHGAQASGSAIAAPAPGSGPQRRGEVGPKSATTGVPTAWARWLGAESQVTTTAQRARTAARP